MKLSKKRSRKAEGFTMIMWKNKCKKAHFVFGWGDRTMSGVGDVLMQ